MSETFSSFLAELAATIGPAQISTDPNDLAPHLVEGRGLYRGTAFGLARPRDTDDVSACLWLANRHRLPVVAHGGNTGLVGGGVPRDALVLSLDRMNRIRAVDPVNLTMTVEAGAILKTVQDAATAEGCLFPLSLGSEGSCTIGGNLSTNAGGTAVLRYGNARELALGLEVVLADGRVLNDLNRLRKNNTGYDLRNLFIGAEGTLGIITAAVLKLFPAPRVRATAWVGLDSRQAGLDLFDLVRASAGECLTGYEFMYAEGIDFVLRHIPGTRCPLDSRSPFHVLIELSSSDASLDLAGRLESLLGDAYERGLIGDATIAASVAQAAALWSLREHISDAQKFEGGSIKHDISVPVSAVVAFLDRATAACEAELAGLRVVAFGHFGDGNIHFNLSQPVGMDKAEYLSMWDRFNRIVHDIVADLGGSISAEHGIGLIKLHELARYKDPVALDLMARLKATLDPHNILNPGKVLPPRQSFTA
ncbi:MAG TPA: FAD-binding oxidoreductase [Beijerinckiaceae bacterium]|nr:FAD-binding oxidoreductase [Beijerinckiaceae bacterium]